jgi:hypothetical protein
MWLGIVTAVAALGLPATAAASAWPQEKGSGFASAAVHLSWPQDIRTWQSTDPTRRYDALYFEYGLTDRLTAGLDLGRAISGAIKSVGFLQLPLTAPDAPLKAAGQLGLGVIDGAEVVRPGLSLGMGWERGWLAADALVEQPLDGNAFDVKLDMTFGLNLPRDRKLILQLQSGQQAGDPAFLRVAPSVVIPLLGPVSAELGGIWGLVGDDSMGLKLGVWTEF